MSIVTTKLDEKLFVTRQISINDLAEIAAVGFCNRLNMMMNLSGPLAVGQLEMPALLLPSIQVNIRAGKLLPAEKNGIAYFKIPINFI